MKNNLIEFIFDEHCIQFKGAPPDTCVKERFNQPNHGKARPLPVETSPFQVVASTSYYRPGDTIQVTIHGNDVFRGFFIQARFHSFFSSLYISQRFSKYLNFFF